MSPSLVTPTSSATSLESATASLTIEGGEKTTYEKLNDPKADETSIEEVTDRIARGLFSVLVTMGESAFNLLPSNQNAKLIEKLQDNYR